jgi:ubiquitin-protein ligase
MSKSFLSKLTKKFGHEKLSDNEKDTSTVAGLPQRSQSTLSSVFSSKQKNIGIGTGTGNTSCNSNTTTSRRSSVHIHPTPTNTTTSSSTSSTTLIEPKYQATLREYHILMEYKLLCKSPIHGIYCIPSSAPHHTIYQWDCILFIRKGYYRNAIFKFIIQFHTQRPIDCCPSIIFLSSIYHPLIDTSTGQLDLSQSEFLISCDTTSSSASSSDPINTWDPSKHNILTLLSYVNKIFYDT